MAPIRVGIIGLSSVTTNVPTLGESWAAIAHLPYLLTSPKYEIVALCNSNVKSAQAAVQRFSLPSTTKVYGSPEDLAKDPEVDLVVCAVRVDRHYDVILPSLKAGKDVFVEWPLASNLQQAEELLAAAKQSGSKTIVGLQGRSSPYIQKIKELVRNKAIGNLLSSNLNFATGFPADISSATDAYQQDKNSGAGLLRIIAGHTADAAIYALGGLEDVSALLTTRWPDVKLLHADGTFDKLIKRETPDHIFLHGTLTNNAAPISLSVRTGKVFKDTPSVTWSIFGSKGEIRFTSAAPPHLAAGGDKIELFNHEKDEVKVVDVQFSDAVKDLQSPYAKNVGALYELFAAGGSAEQGFVGFEEAVGYHRTSDAIEKSSEGGKKEKVVV